VCFETAMAGGVGDGGTPADPHHFRLLMSCAEISRTTANFVLAGSRWDMHVRALCTEICEACACSCEQMGGMEECVSVCRRCAASCRQEAYSLVPKHTTIGEIRP
jgi:hypothetical protein